MECGSRPFTMHEKGFAVRSSMLPVLPRLAIALLLICFIPAPGTAETVCARGGVVSSASGPATSVGVEILERGGNAVDAAVAVGFALAVTHPRAGNIGGGGFLLARLASGEAVFLDFREKAPLSASRDMYLDERGEVVPDMSLRGAAASGVPGTVSGLQAAHERFGSLPWAEVVAPAVALARDGFAVDERLARSLEALRADLDRFPGLRQFMRPDGTLLAPGDTLRQPELARTLGIIAAEGANGFYRGVVADLIDAEMRAGGGFVTMKDLAAYETVERQPVRGTYRGFEILSAPPPSSGGVILVEILNILERFDLAEMGLLSDRAIHTIVEAERRAYVDRARHLGDPDFVENPVARLTSKAYADSLAGTIEPRATPSGTLDPGRVDDREKGETTHYSVVDRLGNAVAVTTTLNDSYGSRLVVRGAGFLLNNEMDDFSIKPMVPNLYGLVGSEANAIAPGKRMLSSMTPTIVLEDGSPRWVLGSPGGGTIITTIVQLVVDLADFDMTLEGAVAAPRFHHQWRPDRIDVERGLLTRYLRGFLEERGHRIEERDPIGEVHAIEMRAGCACGVADPRGAGTAGGAGPLAEGCE